MTKKTAPKKKAAKTLKKPSNAVIRNSIRLTGSKSVAKINTDLKRKGYAPINAYHRDRAIKEIENNQSPKPVKTQKTGKRVNNGGARKGAGRKKGAATTKTREIADKLAADGELTPLEYLLGVMRETPATIKAQYEAGELDAVEYAVKLTELTKRRDNAAEKAAPYIHPRLASIEAEVKGSEHEKWLAIMAAAEAAA